VTESELEDLLSTPSPADVAAAREIDGDVLVLGAAGKMGPSLAVRLRRALDAAGNPARVTTVARRSLSLAGVAHIEADLLDPQALQSLPNTPNVFFLAARKFGSSGQPWLTWVTNVVLPGMVARRFRESRIVAFSSGNVYPLVPVASSGATEETPPAPIGEYAWSVLGRERVFEHASATWGTPVTLLRLNYAVELRYGVLVDLALKVWEGQPIDLSMGHVNVIWQGDANSVCLRSLAHSASPPFVLNLTGPETLSVRALASEFGSRFDKPVRFTGEESPDALLNNASLCRQLFGAPTVALGRMMDWVAEWVRSDGRLLNKPTHFQTRNGRF
jgi:nucleoside-diphosphate-sugar epimerase